MAESAASSSRRVAIALAADTIALVVFALLGRNNHQTASSPFEIAAPFLIGATVGWVVSRGWRSPFALTTGIAVWLGTVVVGMLLRRMVWERGVQTSFVIVATVFTGLFLLGWRVAAARGVRRSATK